MMKHPAFELKQKATINCPETASPFILQRIITDLNLRIAHAESDFALQMTPMKHCYSFTDIENSTVDFKNVLHNGIVYMDNNGSNQETFSEFREENVAR